MISTNTEWRTFKDWSADGYTITKGSKATWFDGVPKFSREQVNRRFSQRRAAIYESIQSAWEDDGLYVPGGGMCGPSDWGDI